MIYDFLPTKRGGVSIEFKGVRYFTQIKSPQI